MKKKISLIAGGVLIAVLLVANTAHAESSHGQPFAQIWKAIARLQQAIANIPAGPQGPQGPAGPQGPQGEPGASGALADVYGGTQTPEQYVAVGDTATWSWKTPVEGSFTAIARVNYTLSTPAGSGARLTCGIQKEGTAGFLDAASDSINLDHTDTTYVTNGKEGSFTLTVPIEFLNAGQAVSVGCTTLSGGSNSALIHSASLELLPFNQFHALTETTL